MNEVVNALSQFSSGSFWSVVGLWTAGMFSVVKAFDFVDGRISKVAKADAARYLRGVDVEAPFNGLSQCSTSPSRQCLSETLLVALVHYERPCLGRYYDPSGDPNSGAW